MLKRLFRPLQNFALRILLFVIALVLFMTGGLYVAAWLSSPQPIVTWRIAVPLVIAGGLLLFKARSPGDPPQ